MRRFGYCVAIASIVLLGQISFAANPSFFDAFTQVQKDQQSCRQADNSYDAACIKKYSADYSALYQAALPLASQAVDTTNPLAALAQKQLQQYQNAKTYIEQNALGLMNGTTTIPDSLLGGAGAAPAPSISQPPAGPKPTATAKCPNDSIVTSLASATLNAIEATDKFVTGTVQGVTTGEVQVCVKGAQMGDPVPVGKDGSFKLTVPDGTKLTNGDSVVAQYISPGSNGEPDPYGPAPDANSVLVSSCSMAGSGSSTPPTLVVSQPDEKGVVPSFTGTASGATKGTTVRICVNDIPLLDKTGKEVTATTTDANGNFSGASTFNVKAGDQIVAQTETLGTSGTPAAYGLVSKPPIQINSAGLIVGSPPSDGFVATLVAGVEQSGYSSLGNDTGGFLSAFFRSGYIPLGQTRPLGIAAWGRVRLLSAPQPGTVGIASILTDPTGTLSTQTYTSIGTAVDYLVGPELKLKEWNYGSAKSRISLIAGVGATTPLSSSSVTVSYAVPPPNTAECQQLIKQYGPNTGNVPYLFANPNLPGTPQSCVYNPATGTPYNFISFANQNRSNFLFKWGAGGRFTHVFPARGTTPRYTGSLDVAVGQDSSVTGGKVSGWVFKLDGVYPIPYTGSFLYVFGSAAMRFTHNQNYAPLILANATNAPTPPSTQVAVLSLQQPNRDFYRLGFGVNLTTIWCKFATAGCPQGAAAQADSAKPAAPANNAAPATPPAKAGGS